MINNQKVLAIIPARGTSKGVPRKNIKLLAGKPLIAYAIEEAKKSDYIDRIIVLTEDNEIAEIARKYGAEIPFMEPDKLAKEEDDVIYLRYAVEQMGKKCNFRPEIIVLLRATSPLRKVEHINAAIEKLEKTNADGVRTVCVSPAHPHKMWKIEAGRLFPLQKTEIWVKGGSDIPRQKLPKVYWQNGAVDVFKSKNLLKYNYLFGEGMDIKSVVMDDRDSVDIDEPIDFLIAEVILEERNKEK